MWRAPAFDGAADSQVFEGSYSNVPVKLYVAWYGSIEFDLDGNPNATYLEPFEGVELCTGVVEKLTDAAGHLGYNSPVRTICDTPWNTFATAGASSDPVDTPENPAGPPDTWVPVGLGVGVTKGPEQPGRYVLVAEPLDPVFRRGDAWRVMSPFLPDGFVGFEVDGGFFTDDQYRRFTEDPIRIEAPLAMRAVFRSDSTAPTLPITVRASVKETVYHEIPLEAQLDAMSPFGGSYYSARFQAVPYVEGADPPPAEPPVLDVPPLDFMLAAEPGAVGKGNGKQHTEYVVAPRPGRASWNVGFGELDPKENPDPRKILVSNCPDQNPGCAGMSLPYTRQTAVATDLLGPEVEVTLTPKIAPGHEPPPPEPYCIMVRLEDPEDRSLYAAAVADDNLDRLTTTGNNMPQSVVRVSGGVPQPTHSIMLGGEKYYALPLDSSHSVLVRLQNLSKWPGDNYRLLAYLLPVSGWSGATPTFSQPLTSEPDDKVASADLEIWDRLFIEADEGYSRGMVFSSILLAGQSQVNLLAADFTLHEDAGTELGCINLAIPGPCCDQPTGDCIHPHAFVFDADHQTPVEVQVASVDCGASLSNADRLTRECTVTLLDVGGAPLSLPYDLTWMSQTAALVAGDRLSMPPAARSYIQQNLEAVFFEAVFLPGEAQGQPHVPGLLPKVPRECTDTTVNHLDTEWRWNLLRPYFDNNQPSPLALWHDIDNVVHLLTTSDYDGGCSTIRPRLGTSRHSVNISEAYLDRILAHGSDPPEWWNSIWVHELVHQFAVNHCHQDTSVQPPENDDHCDELGATVFFGLPGTCLMNVDAGFHGPYLGASCAVPGAPGVTAPRAVCHDPNNTDIPNYVRYNHFLNAAPSP